MKRTTQSVLVLASTGVMMGIAYTPQNHKKPTADVVANYIHGKFYNPFKSQRDMDRSEARKQEILQKIAATRSAIRTQVDQFHKNQAAENLLKSIACTMENRTASRDNALRSQRCKEIKIPARLISADVLRKRKGMPVVDLSEV